MMFFREGHSKTRELTGPLIPGGAVVRNDCHGLHRDRRLGHLLPSDASAAAVSFEAEDVLNLVSIKPFDRIVQLLVIGALIGQWVVDACRPAGVLKCAEDPLLVRRVP